MLETRNKCGLSSMLKIVERPRRREPKPPKFEKKSKKVYSLLIHSNLFALISNVIASCIRLSYGRMRKGYSIDSNI